MEACRKQYSNASHRNRKLGQPRQYVSGKTVPRKEILQFLADVLSVEGDWLLGKENHVPKQRFTEDAKTEKFNLSSQKEGNNMREFKKSNKLENVLYLGV